MSVQTLPLLFFNMGGEMVYILDQRLRAQNIKRDKAGRVLSDIAATMFSSRFMKELFKAQEIYSKQSLRALFDRLAHTSIMRLNENSMDKLYDLMVMAVKYQLSSCMSPREILTVTLNHLDGVRKLVTSNEQVVELIDSAYEMFYEDYKDLNYSQLYLLKMTMMQFYQDSRVKISILLREGKQQQDGRFIIPLSGTIGFGGMPPGQIRIYQKGKVIDKLGFSSGGSFDDCKIEASLRQNAKASERGTTLGENMYKDSTTTEIKGGEGFTTSTSTPSSSSKSKSIETTSKDELNLLRLLVGSAEKAKNNFSLSLFEDDDDEKEFVAHVKKSEKQNTIRIDASKRDKQKSIDHALADVDISGRSSRGDSANRKGSGKGQRQRSASAKKRKPKGEEFLDMMGD